MCSKSRPIGTLLGGLWPPKSHKISYRSLPGIPEKIDAILKASRVKKCLKMTSKMGGLFFVLEPFFSFCDSLPSQMGPGRPQTLKNHKKSSKMTSSFNLFSMLWAAFSEASGLYACSYHGVVGCGDDTPQASSIKKLSNLARR